MLGRTISHYRVREKIGSGGMGDVYRAVDLQLDRPVALKFLNDELLHEDAAVERLHREARAIARMAHPNIATLYEIVRTPETIFLVLEFLEGESLDLRLAHGSMGLDEILRVGIGVARGLAEAHAHGIVHRDVKPANVMLSPRGDVKILDFGLARVPVANKDRACGPEATPAGTVRGDIASRAWAAGQEKTLEIADGISGTLSYMAPEQLSGAPPDPSMDVYALGVMLYRMCCGSLPFTAANRPELVAKILCDRAPRPGQFHPDLPRELERLIEDCLEKEPTHRPSSAGFVADELEALAHRHLRRSLHGTQRLAVLPFVDMSAEGDQAYFCDGITEELILGLSHVAKLDVIARTSVFRYKNSPMDIRRIGHDLGADAVLEGSVRKAGERLRITAQLIDVASGNPLWSESYDRQLRDVLAVQDEIARNIVRALEVTLQPGESMPRAYRRARDPEAYDYYLRGRQFFYLYHRRGMELALKMFGLAVEHDPDFALAYTGMTNCWSYLFLYADRRSESLQKADEASLRALELDPGLAEAHVAREVEGDVDAEAVRLGHRVDQFGCRRRAGHGRVVAAGMGGLQGPAGPVAGTGVVERDGAVAGAVDQMARGDGVAAAVGIREGHARPVRPRLDGGHALPPGGCTAGGLGVAQQAHGEGVAVEDARDRHLEGGDAGDAGRPGGEGRAVESPQSGHAVGAGGVLDFGEALALVIRGRDHELAALAVRQPALAQVGIGPLAARGAEHGLVRARRVVEPGVDDLAVARGGVL